MNRSMAFSVCVRSLAVLAAAAALLSQAPPARSAPLFQAALPVVPVPNMVAYWPLDAAVASVTSDLSGNANNGTLQPGALIDAVNKAAVPPGNPASLAITGASNQIVIVPDSASLSFTGSFTLAAWIRPTAAPGGTQRGIIEKWDWSGTYAQNGYMMRLDASNYLSFAVCGATGNIGISTAPRTVSSAGGWTHVAGTYDSTSGNMIMYVGGAADPTTGNAAGASPANGISELHLGGDYGSNRFAGNIDEARIYTRALTQPEIMILINGQPAPTGLVAAGQPGQINLTWTAAAGATTYSLLRGTASGTYTTVVNGIAGTTYNDTTATPGTPYFYVVVAVSVMTSNPSNQSSATAAPAGPPPPPPPPRTQQVGNGKGMCGCSTVTPAAMPWGTLGALLAAAMFLALPRRGARKA